MTLTLHQTAACVCQTINDWSKLCPCTIILLNKMLSLSSMLYVLICLVWCQWWLSCDIPALKKSLSIMLMTMIIIIIIIIIGNFCIFLQIVATSCPNLEHIGLSYCTKINSDGMKILVEKCPKLVGFDLSYMSVSETGQTLPQSICLKWSVICMICSVCFCFTAWIICASLVQCTQNLQVRIPTK